MKRWVRERWKELRWGMGAYLAPAVTTFNLILLISLYFKVEGAAFIFLASGMLALLLVMGISVGHVHRLWQQDTDALLENKSVIDEIVRRISEMKEK